MNFHCLLLVIFTVCPITTFGKDASLGSGSPSDGEKDNSNLEEVKSSTQAALQDLGAVVNSSALGSSEDLGSGMDLGSVANLGSGADKRDSMDLGGGEDVGSYSDYMDLGFGVVGKEQGEATNLKGRAPHYLMRKTSKCLQMKSDALAKDLLNHYIPQCKDDGTYEPRQCNWGTRSCWCVDVDGHRLSRSEDDISDGIHCEEKMDTTEDDGTEENSDTTADDADEETEDDANEETNDDAKEDKKDDAKEEKKDDAKVENKDDAKEENKDDVKEEKKDDKEEKSKDDAKEDKAD